MGISSLAILTANWYWYFFIGLVLSRLYSSLWCKLTRLDKSCCTKTLGLDIIDSRLGLDFQRLVPNTGSWLPWRIAGHRPGGQAQNLLMVIPIMTSCHYECVSDIKSILLSSGPQVLRVSRKKAQTIKG